MLRKRTDGIDVWPPMPHLIL